MNDFELLGQLKAIHNSLHSLHEKADIIMGNQQELDTAIATEGQTVTAVVAAVQALVDKTAGSGVDLSAEIAAINQQTSQLGSAVAQANGTTPPPTPPPVTPPPAS